MPTPIDPAQFTLFSDSLPESLILIEPNGKVVALNRAATKRFPALSPGDDLRDCVMDDDRSLTRLLKIWRRAGQPSPGVLLGRDPHTDGSPVSLRCEGSAVAQGQAIVVRCRAQTEATKPFSVLNEEIKKLQHANHDLRHDREYLAKRVEERTRTIRESERRLRGILEALAEAVVCFTRDGAIISTNAAADNLFGYPKDRLNGVAMGTLLPDASDHATPTLNSSGRSMETVAIDRDGRQFPVEVKIRELILQDDTVFTALITDITERTAHLTRLKRLAERDALTGLFNRRYFQEHLDAITTSERGQRLSLLFIDLDNFKFVNDALGHGAGDRVLVEVANLVGRQARSTDLLARLGGDEFALIVDGAADAEVDQIAERVRRSLESYRYVSAEGRADVGCSIGVASFSANTSAASWVGQAEFACRQAKSRGRNRVWRFTPSDAEAAAVGNHEMGWARRIKRAIKEDRFVLYAQPIKHTRSGALAASEVLIRMVGDDGELIMPNAFIPAAERFGLMPEVDRWVIRHALAISAKQGLPLSINLSGTTVADPALADFIAEQINAHGVRPDRLVFEVTETAAIANLADTAQVLSTLQSLGCQTALDDFGSGMSSFGYLRELPVNWVKIDGRFVKDIHNSAVDRAMVRAMHDIAHTLGKSTVAEFVENEASLAILQDLGIDYAQGYHLGRPEAVDQDTHQPEAPISRLGEAS